LNLILHKGPKVFSDALHKIRESVNYVKGFEAKKITFWSLCGHEWQHLYDIH
jgi:hypothetical protein